MIHLLRLLHIVAGAFWYGSVVFLARFLVPSLRASGPAAGPVMAQLNENKMSQVLMAAAIVNVGAGIGLIFVVSGGNLGAWLQLSSSRTFLAGGALAILALIIGVAMNPPAAKRLGAIAAGIAKRGGPPTPEEGAEIARLQKRLGLGGVIVAVILTLAVAAMAVARYT